MKKIYEITIAGSEGETIFDIELNSDECILLTRIAEKSKEISEDGFEPIMEIKQK